MSFVPLNQQLVLPNTLINARYPLSVPTMQFWQALLAHLPPQGSEFQETCVPIGEALAPSGRKLSDKDYAVLAVMNGQLSAAFLEFAGPAGTAPPLEPGAPLPLLDYVHYEKTGFASGEARAATALLADMVGHYRAPQASV